MKWIPNNMLGIIQVFEASVIDTSYGYQYLVVCFADTGWLVCLNGLHQLRMQHTATSRHFASGLSIGR